MAFAGALAPIGIAIANSWEQILRPLCSRLPLEQVQLSHPDGLRNKPDHGRVYAFEIPRLCQIWLAIGHYFIRLLRIHTAASVPLLLEHHLLPRKGYDVGEGHKPHTFVPLVRSNACM